MQSMALGPVKSITLLGADHLLNTKDGFLQSKRRKVLGTDRLKTAKVWDCKNTFFVYATLQSKRRNVMVKLSVPILFVFAGMFFSTTSFAGGKSTYQWSPPEVWGEWSVPEKKHKTKRRQNTTKWHKTDLGKNSVRESFACERFIQFGLSVNVDLAGWFLHNCGKNPGDPFCKTGLYSDILNIAEKVRIWQKRCGSALR